MPRDEGRFSDNGMPSWRLIWLAAFVGWKAVFAQRAEKQKQPDLSQEILSFLQNLWYSIEKTAEGWSNMVFELKHFDMTLL